MLHSGTDLLYEKGLKPEPANSVRNSLFGVAIDTGGLASVDVDAKERQRLLDIQGQIKELAQLVECEGANLTKLTREVKDLSKDYDRADKAATACRARAQAEEKAYQQAKGAAEASRRARQEKAQEWVERSEKDKHLAEAAHEAQLAENRQALKALKEAQHGETVALNEELRRERGILSDSRKNATAQKDTAVEHWEEVRKAKLADAGVSEEQLEKARQTLKAANQAHGEAHEAQRRAGSWYALLEEIDDKASQIIHRLQEKQEVLGTPEALDEATVQAKTGLDVRLLEAENDTLRKALEDDRLELHKRMRDFERMFSRTDSSMCLRFAESEGLSSKVGRGEARDLLAAAAVLKGFYGPPDYWQSNDQYFPPDSHGERLEEVVRGGISYKLELRGFVDGLEELKRQIQQSNRAIKSHFNAMLDHVPSIETIDVDATFDLESVDGYGAAQKAVVAISSYELKRSASGDERLLPGKAMRQAFEDLIRYLETRRYDKKVDLLDAVRMTFQVKR